MAKKLSDRVVAGEAWVSAIEKVYLYGPVVAGILGMTSLGTWFATNIKGLPVSGWGIYPFIGAGLAFILSGAFAFALWAMNQWVVRRGAALTQPDQGTVTLIDPFLPTGKRTFARVLIDPNNWRAEALKKENIFEVKARFLNEEKTAVQLVVIFQRWTFERGARIHADSRLEKYGTTEDAMSERYAIYSVYGIKTPCIIDIEFQSGLIPPEDAESSFRPPPSTVKEKQP